MKNYFVLIVAIAVTAVGCGSSSDSAPAAPVSGSSIASQAATNASLTAAQTAMKSATAGGLASLSAQPKGTTLEKTMVPVDESFSDTESCGASGSASFSGSVTGNVTVDDATNQPTAVDIDLSMTGTMPDCAEADDPSTSGFDESKIVLNGDITGGGTFSLSGANLNMTMSINGTIKISGDACPDGGKLTMVFTSSGTAPMPEEGEEPKFDCTTEGSFVGTTCGTPVDCTVSGNCDDPTISGTGCK